MSVFTVIGRFLYDLTLRYGVIGLAVGAFLESLGIPTASVVIDLTAGLLIINGRTTFIEALIISDLGLVAGSLVSFMAGRAGAGIFARFYRHPPAEEEHRSRARELIERYGDKSIFFGQLFGPARTWISFPAGAMGMDIKKFTIYTALGGAIYCAVIILISLYFTDLIQRRYREVLNLLSIPVIVGVVVLVVAGVFLRRWVKGRRQ